MMKTSLSFFHLADCHVGAWREPRMRDLNLQAFLHSIDLISKKGCDFVLLSGDLFNSAMPSIDALKGVTGGLKKLYDLGIQVYSIAGSHDYSASGKSMLEVLEEAHLIKNVMKGFVDDSGNLVLDFVEGPEGVKIGGIIGKRGSLERKYYDAIDYSKIPDGIKLFLFHSAISEYKPLELADMDSIPLSVLPKGCSYYAGGHVHYRFEKDEAGYGKIVFPGPLFPNNFRELWDLKDGSMRYCELDLNTGGVTSEEILIENNTFCLEIDATNLSASDLGLKIIEKLDENLSGKIVLLRLKGMLKEGSISDIGFEQINEIIYSRGALCAIRNTIGLNMINLDEIISDIGDLENLENEVIREHVSQSNLKNTNLVDINEEDQFSLIKKLMVNLSSSKKEGETKIDYEERILGEFNLNVGKK